MIELAEGVFHLPAFLAPTAQHSLVERCRELGREVGFYTPVVRGGRKMSLQMLCLGMHWNPQRYAYEAARSDYDGCPAPPVPADWARLAEAAAGQVGMMIDPQVCLVNWYAARSRLGLHVDKDERRETLEAGIPIVSFSMGDTATFLLGGVRRRDPVLRLQLRSGDALVMGGPGRLRYHGVSGITPSTGPRGLELEGRINLTFRQYALAAS